MNKKKAGLVVAGAVTAVLAASPLAWAGGTGHHDGPRHDSGKACAFVGGDGAAGSGIDGDSLANVVAQAPVSGNNVGNIGNCSDFLNNNLNGNLSGNNVDVLGGLLP